MKRKFNITYTDANRESKRLSVEIEAASKYDAKSKFYHKHPEAEIIKIEEIKE